MMFARISFVAAAALLLSACLWSPGKFVSNLDVRADGSFALDYKGEILFQVPDDDAKPAPWSDDKAHCAVGGGASLEPDGSEARDCTPAEIAALKAEFERKEGERVAAKRKENEEMARMFGLPGTDDASNRRFAATLMKYAGWRSVIYKGGGVYDVDYAIQGRLTQDFAFPMMPESDLVLPFIAIRRRADGSVQVTAPALAGGEGPFAARGRLMGLAKRGEGGEPMKADGRFTLTTDGEILTNNSEDGPAVHPRGRAVAWQVGPASTRTPEALIRLR